MEINIRLLILFFTGIFFSILFIQSSLDKIFNWKSELAFNKEHFSKTLLNPFTPLMFSILTLMELSSGMLSAISVIMICTSHAIIISFYAACLCACTFLCLFLGQRIAKDYGGAQSLVSYFIVSIIAIYFSISL